MLVTEVAAFRDYWYAVAYSADLAAEPVRARLLGVDYVVWRPASGEPVSAAVDECPHRSAALSQGWITDGCLVCPYHGWHYDGSGACVEIPAQDPSVPIPSRAHVRSVLAGEKYGLVWICAGTPRAPIPVLPEIDEGYTLVHELMEVWNASAPRIVDNALDVSHVAFVHRDSVGDPDNPRLSDYRLERDGERLWFSVTYTSNVRGVQAANTGLSGPVTRTTHAELVQPFVFRGVLEYENGLRHVLYKTAAPVDDSSTLFCQFIARNDAPDAERQAGIIAVDRQVQTEDRRLLERIKADFPLDTTAELHTRSDRMTIEYRRILADIAAGVPAVPAPAGDDLVSPRV
jgi:phenylpropionate dioxygenase-like ring-hydroxylating dioxygenase large terminal subunit